MRRPQASQKPLILLAEDESMIRSVGILALSSLGYEVIDAEDGAEALEKFRSYPIGEINIVMTDIRMPKMDGVELATRILKLAPATAILFNSGYGNEAINSDRLAENCLFLQKPYSINSLREILAHLD